MTMWTNDELTRLFCGMVQAATGNRQSCFASRFRRAIPSLALLLLTALCGCLQVDAQSQSSPKPIYLDAKQPIEARVADLMQRMTLKEKV
jgi:hypothetical protein